MIILHHTISEIFRLFKKHPQISLHHILGNKWSLRSCWITGHSHQTYWRHNQWVIIKSTICILIVLNNLRILRNYRLKELQKTFITINNKKEYRKLDKDNMHSSIKIRITNDILTNKKKTQRSKRDKDKWQFAMPVGNRIITLHLVDN